MAMPFHKDFDFRVPQSDATTMKTYGPPAAWPADRVATMVPTMTYPRVPDEDAPMLKRAVQVVMPRGQQPPLHALGRLNRHRLGAIDAHGRAFSFGGLGGPKVYPGLCGMGDCETGANGEPRSLVGRWFCKGTDAFFDKDTSSVASRMVALVVFGLITLSVVKAAPKIFGSI